MTTADLKKFITETLFTDPRVREAMQLRGDVLPPYQDVRNWKRSRKVKLVSQEEFDEKLNLDFEDLGYGDWTHGEPPAPGTAPWVARYFVFEAGDAHVDPKLEEELGDAGVYRGFNFRG